MLRIVIVSFAVIAVAGSAFGGVQLKQSFFSGWRYSLDGVHWHGVGISGSKLLAEMNASEEITSNMKSYRGWKVGGVVLTTTGAGLSFWAGYSAVEDDAWESKHLALFVAGVGCTLFGALCEVTATNKLLRAVYLHNLDEKSIGLHFGYRPILRNGAIEHKVGVSIGF